jgi:hypothetical protein
VLPWSVIGHPPSPIDRIARPRGRTSSRGNATNSVRMIGFADPSFGVN